MLPWHVRFRVNGVPIESVDSVRYAAALSFARSVSTPERRFPQLERLQQQDVEIDGPALIQELDTLARLAPAEGLAAVLGNIRDDVLKGLAIAAGRG
jgi:hypothetical protein